MKRFRMNGKTGSRVLTGVGLSMILLGSIIPAPKMEEGIEVSVPSYVYMSYNTEQFRYLSDTPYIKEQSSVGYSTILLDRNIESKFNNGLITLNINGKNTSFIKGVSAHATSTLVYDLSDYNYDYFTSYIGVDASMGNNGNGVKFAIYTSKDGETWDLQTDVKPPVMKGTSEAMDVKIAIRDAKYLKLYCNSNGNKDSDHCVYANAKLIKEDYVPEDDQPVDFIKTVDEYNQILQGQTLEQQLTTGELTLLQREFVKNVGYDYLQMYAQYSDEFKEVVQWLMNDRDSLNMYIMGGKPAGSYLESLKVLVELYKNYHNDWTSTEVSKYGVVKGDVYKRMAFALSLTHSTRVALWMQPSAPENQSNAVVRYAIFKQLYDEGKFQVTNDIDITKWFENYTVEEMRFVMNTALDDEEILWLHDYTQSQIDQNPSRAWTYLTPHPYMAYVWPNYANPVFHDPERKEYWDEKYNGIFSKYGVTYSTEGNMVYKVWMNLRTEFGTGAVCGGISKTGSNIRAVHGIPASVIGQPGHAAIIYYHENAEGKGYWNIDNDVSGWTLSEKSERMLLGWGNDTRYVRGYNVPYIIMAQEAMNRFDEYERSAKLKMIADSYTNDSASKEYYLRESLKSLDFNIDTWYELISLYLNDETKTEEDFYNLANEMSQSLVKFPLPYYNLMATIEPKLTSNAYKFKYSLLLTDTLNKGKDYNGTEVLQPAATRLLASYLLGKTDTSLATFSFDGENAGNIVLSDRFNGSGIRWDYSIDGKQTWHEIAFTAEEEHKHALTLEELVNITEENDIYVHIVGVNYNEENLYKIDIQKGTVSTTLYNNDLENRVIGVNSTYEWKFQESDPWTSFADKEPDLGGDKTVQVRVGATGTYLPSDAVTFNFTKDTDTDTRKYVTVNHLSIHNVSTEATSHQGHATNAIDANYNTRYHSAWNGTDTERYMTIKLDEPMYISAVEFVPAGGGNGKIYDGTIYGSMDGENWEVLTSQQGFTYKNQANTIQDAIQNTKSFDIAEPKKVQYVKIVADRTNGNWFTARAFNFYQDITIQDEPTPSESPVPTPSETPVPTPSETPVPTPSETPVPTPSESPVPTPSESPVPTPSATPVPTPIETPVPIPSESPVPTPSESPVPTPSESPVPTPSESPVPTPSATPVPTPSESPVPTPSESPVPTPSATPVPTPSATPVPVPTNTPLPTIDPTFRPSVTPAPSASLNVKIPSGAAATSYPTKTYTPVVRSTPNATASATPDSKSEESQTTQKEATASKENVKTENTKSDIVDVTNDKKNEMQEFFAIILMIVAIVGILLIIF